MTTRQLWTQDVPLVLASTSATRRKLLLDAGLAIETESPGVDERAIEAAASAAGATATELAVRLAREKALAVSRRRGEAAVLGADQILVLDGEILHKPADRHAARRHLLRLAGRPHTLITAAALARNGEILDVVLDEAELTMRPLDAAAIDTYLDLAGPAVLDSVGCYQIEGLGIHLFGNVTGDHATILGLPLRALLAVLRRRGCLAF
jgi:septum formation protein